MSLHPSTKLTRPANSCKPPVAIELDQDARRAQSVKTVRISWKVSRSALGEHAPDGHCPFVTLELAINPCDADQPMSCSVIDPKQATRRAIELSGPNPTIRVVDSAMGIVIESSDLICHLRANDQLDGYELVYIRSSIFEQLNIPGGRYEPIGAQVESNEARPN